MKRTVFIISLVLALLFVLAPTASAYDPTPPRVYDPTLPRVIDETGLLSDYEKEKLKNYSEEFRFDHSMDCVVMLVTTTGGKSAMAFADDAYDEGGYGMGADNSGILILIAVGDREVYISTCGAAIDAISDGEIELILDEMMYSLSNEDWGAAFVEGIDAAGRMIERPNGSGYGNVIDRPNGSSYDDGNKFTPGKIAAVVLLPAVISGIVLAVMCYRMNNDRGKRTAADYAVRGSFALSGALDIFLTSSVTKTPRAESNSGGGGGSSHVSSGGVSHGGGGRHF